MKADLMLLGCAWHSCVREYVVVWRKREFGALGSLTLVTASMLERAA